MDYSACIMYYLKETNVCETVGRYNLAVKISEQSCFKNAVMKVNSMNDSSVS
jgi:hypothetical protein